MGALMLVVSLLVAASEETLISRMKAATPKIKRAASYILIFVGSFNIYTAINLPFFLDLLFPLLARLRTRHRNGAFEPRMGAGLN